MTEPTASAAAKAPNADFDAALASVADVDGWMTDAQARRLWDAASALEPPARIVEIGSYRGRSIIVLARAADPAVEVVAIDPHAGNDRGPQEIHGTRDEGNADHEAFMANLRRTGLEARVRHVRKPSGDALGDVQGEIALLYIDGAHRYGPARDDIRDWGARVAERGTLLIHDSFSSVGVTAAIFTQLAVGGRFRYEGRSGSLAQYRRQHLGAGARLGNLGRHIAQLPWFLRNVIIKVLIVLKLRPLTRLLGHRGGHWPY